MLRSLCRPRFSLRTLLFLMLIVAVSIQTAVALRKHQQQVRRQVFMEDVRAQIVVSQRIGPVYGEKLRTFVRRRVTNKQDTSFLSAADRTTLLNEVERGRISQQVVLLAHE
jgi:hypothetical protein